MESRHRKVQQWLQPLFEDGQVPGYEICSRTVDLLCSLCEECERQEDRANLIIEDIKRKETEYNAEGNYMSGVLKNLGLSVESLSQSGTVSVRTLASIASSLQLRDCRAVSYMLALQDHSQSLFRAAETQLEQKHHLEQMEKRIAVISSQNEHLRSAVASANEQTAEELRSLATKVQDRDFLSRKAADYSRLLQQAESDLKDCGTSDDISHSQLVKRHRELNESRKQLQPERAKVHAYHSLPPDISLARLKIEELRHELANLEDQLLRKINLTQS